MHQCKVKTTNSSKITNDEYQRVYKEVNDETFFYPLNKIYQQYALSNISQLVLHQKQFAIPMKRNLFRLLEIKGSIQGQKVKFLIDTGAQISAIRPHLLQKLNLKKYPSLEVEGFGGTKSQLETVVVEQLAFGEIEVINHPMVLLSAQTFSLKIANLELISFDAILGWDILSRIDFELVDVSQTFKCIQNEYRFKYPNSIIGSFPLIIGRRQNEVVKIGIDTGAYYGWISKNYLAKHQIEGIEIETLSYGVNGKEKNQTQLVQDFDVLLDRGYIKLNELIQGPCEMFTHFHYDMILGNEIFKGRRIRFINSASMVLFT